MPRAVRAHTSPRLVLRRNASAPTTTRCLEHRRNGSKEAGPTPEAPFHAGRIPNTSLGRLFSRVCSLLSLAAVGAREPAENSYKNKDSRRSFSYLPTRIDGVSHLSSGDPAPHTGISGQARRIQILSASPGQGQGTGLSRTPQQCSGGRLTYTPVREPQLPQAGLAGRLCNTPWAGCACARAVRTLGWNQALRELPGEGVQPGCQSVLGFGAAQIQWARRARQVRIQRRAQLRGSGKMVPPKLRATASLRFLGWRATLSTAGPQLADPPLRTASCAESPTEELISTHRGGASLQISKTGGMTNQDEVLTSGFQGLRRAHGRSVSMCSRAQPPCALLCARSRRCGPVAG